MRRKRRRGELQPRKKPRQERARETVAAILQSSTYILKKHGYAGLTTNRIAERAGVNIASVYQYFPNKEAIFVELLRRHVEELRRHVSAVLRQGRSFESQVRHVVETTIAVHAVEPELHRIFTTEALRLGLPPFETDTDASLREAAANWAARVKRPNAEMALWIAQTAVHSILHVALLERPDIVESEAFADELTHLVVRYLSQ